MNGRTELACLMHDKKRNGRGDCVPYSRNHPHESVDPEAHACSWNHQSSVQPRSQCLEPSDTFTTRQLARRVVAAVCAVHAFQMDSHDKICKPPIESAAASSNQRLKCGYRNTKEQSTA